MANKARPGKARSRRTARWVSAVAASVVALLGGGWGWYYASTRQLAFDLVEARNLNRDINRTIPEEVTEHLRVDGADEGVVLDVWLIEPRRQRPPESVDWVVILHGIADQKRTLLGLGRRFANHGVGAILVDLRGHGLSTSDQLTFGARDVFDLSRVLDAVEEHGHPLGEVGAYGASYGGGIALQLAAHDDRVRRAVAVGAFASFRRIIRPYIEEHHERWAWLIPGFFIDTMVHLAGIRAGFDPAKASAERAVAASRNARFLLIHSREDDVVPFEHAEVIIAKCAGRCELLALDDFDHLGSLSNQPLRERLHLFLEGQPLTSL